MKEIGESTMRHLITRNSCQFIVLVGTLALLIITGTAETVFCQEKTIILATADYEPLLGENLKDGGVFTALTREAFRRVGYRFEVEFVPWKRAIVQAKAGEYDGVLGAVLTPEREPFFTNTEAIMPFKHLFFSRIEDTITYTDLHELESYRIGIVNGSAIEGTLTEAELTFEAVTTYEQNLNKLMLGRIDLMVGDNFLMMDLLKKHPEYDGKINPVSPPIKISTLQNLISKARPDHSTVVADFNRALQEMKEDGTFNAIVEEYGFSKLW